MRLFAICAGTALSMAVCCARLYASAMPEIHGFIEHAGAVKTSDNELVKHGSFNLLEQRLQLKASHAFPVESILGTWQSVARFKGDFTVDEHYAGKTGFDLREANLSMSPASFVDVKLGRQVLTWGTGDYIFINDVFPKDYESFYIGRDDEYLKKPSDAVRLSVYPPFLNADFVAIPFFEPNALPQGDRLSFFDSFQGGIAGRESDRHLIEQPGQGHNIEYAVRLYRNFKSTEIAFYAFRGFDKMPRSYKSESSRQLYYQRQNVFGASLRSPVFSGIGNLEMGYVHSPEDSAGTNRLVENSIFKALAGYEKDLGNDLKIGVQYYYEQRLNYADYMQALLSRDFFWDEYRHLLTQRITKLYMNQTVMVSLFNFYSPSDHDGYARPSISYAITDRWKITAGANIPWGSHETTDFGQMKKNKNIFLRLRYSF